MHPPFDESAMRSDPPGLLRPILLCAAGLLAGAAIGYPWACSGRGLFIAALIEIVALLSYLRHVRRTMMAPPSPSPAPRDRNMTRTRKIATRMRDLRQAAEALPDALVVLDRDQRVRWFNHAAESLLGLRRPQDRGSTLPERLRATWLTDWLREGANEPLHDVAAPGQPSRNLSVSMLEFGARQRLLLARDTSHMSRLEQMRRDFVANVSHELRTPLTVIHGYLELLNPEEVPELAPVLGEMRAQSKRMGQIVEDLLTLSRLETQDHIVDERVPMVPLLATLRREAEALSQGRHCVSVEAPLAMDLSGSAKDLHSALSNLVSNAVRYTPTGGSIVIRWQRSDGGAVYSVTDTGYGIPAAHLARLTERFYRVSSSRSRDSGGTGLGLSIVKHVLNLHQARLSIVSEPGQGSTFSCWFGSERLLAPATRDGE